MAVYALSFCGRSQCRVVSVMEGSPRGHDVDACRKFGVDLLGI